MSDVRSAPPDLPGFTVVRGLGGGGFADVFLYTQHRPKRQVAVKVLRRDRLSPESLAQFETEADVMAAVSEHPYIVTIFITDVAPDGRPFIVMEHYSQPHFADRIRRGPLSVAETLRVGVQVASAVETAHRAGILHRDIKPANILTSAFGRPGLTDFGIAGVVHDGAADAAQGVSVAWAPPEALALDADQAPLPHSVQVTSDVYSLAATLHALLTGHPPYSPPGADNSNVAVMARVLNSPVPPLTRDDVPPSLRHLILNALAKDPAARPPSALVFAQGLQAIEQERSLSPTAIEVLDDSATSPPETTRPTGDEDRTRRAHPKIVDPDGPPRPTGASAIGSATLAPTGPGVITSVPAGSAPPAASRKGPTPAVDDTEIVGRRSHDTSDDADDALDVDTTAPRARRPWLIAVAGGVLVAAVAAGALWRGGGSSDAASTTTTSPDQALDAPLVPSERVAAPDDVTVTYDAATRDLTVTWTPPPDNEGVDVTYRVHNVDGSDAPLARFVDTNDTSVTVTDVDPGGSPFCIAVSASVAGRVVDQSNEACVEDGS